MAWLAEMNGVATQANSVIWYWPLGRSVPNNVDAVSFWMLSFTPMVFHWAWSSCSMLARSVFPLVDLRVKVRSWPFWGPELGWKYPSEPMVMPADWSRDLALATSTVSKAGPLSTYPGWPGTSRRLPRGTMDGSYSTMVRATICL